MAVRLPNFIGHDHAYMLEEDFIRTVLAHRTEALRFWPLSAWL